MHLVYRLNKCKEWVDSIINQAMGYTECVLPAAMPEQSLFGHGIYRVCFWNFHHHCFTIGLDAFAELSALLPILIV